MRYFQRCNEHKGLWIKETNVLNILHVTSIVILLKLQDPEVEGCAHLQNVGTLPASCSRVLLQKLTGSQPARKFPAFYGTLNFITVCTSASHLIQFWATSIQSMSLHPIYWRSILILSSHLRLGLPNGLFHSRFSTRTLYTLLLFPIRATWPARLILLNLITRIKFGGEYRSLSSSLRSFIHPPLLLRPS